MIHPVSCHDVYRCENYVNAKNEDRDVALLSFERKKKSYYLNLPLFFLRLESIRKTSELKDEDELRQKDREEGPTKLSWGRDHANCQSDAKVSRKSNVKIGNDLID